MGTRKRLRQWGIALPGLPPGPLNAITDVPGVEVGHCTLIQGESIRTGVTAILPHGGNLYQEKVPAAVEVINGFGKAVGLSQIAELGQIETPIILTNTLSVGAALDALVEYKLERNPRIGREQATVNGVVAECNDGKLNDIRARAIGREQVRAAIAAAHRGLPLEGSVGAGTGMTSFGCKGGIGTSSRKAEDYTVGVLVLSNFGLWPQLKIAGVPVGRLLARPAGTEEKGSIVMVVATDAPLDSRQLKRVAKRTGFGLARTGSVAGHGSGDYALAFSTANRQSADETGLISASRLADSRLGPLFQAAVEATEEAILNALFVADDLVGREGYVSPALPIASVLETLNNYHPVDKGEE
jgi:D-aminopeptidase